MTNVRNLLFISALPLFFVSFSTEVRGADALDPKKFTVCSASINSTEEADVVRKHLSSGKNRESFQFVELTQLGTPPDQTSGVVPDWFERACQSGIQCDMLVISAHFTSTGYFSDKTNPSPLRYPLRTENVEAHACSKDCSGILSNPREIFMMSCNTLATKKEDHRTPEKYLEILKNDGAIRSKAERAVEDRYGELGPTNREQTEFEFAGSFRLYGFKSTSQLADNNARYLDDYFNHIPDYSQHLQKDATLQMSKGLDQLQKFAPNLEMSSAFRETSFCQASGKYPDDGNTEKELWKNLCALRNEQTPLIDRLKLARSILSRPDVALYVPDLELFFEKHSPDVYPMSDEEKNELSTFSDLPNAKTFVLKEIEQKKDYPTLRKRLIQLAATMSWIDKDRAQALFVDVQNQLQNSDGWPTESAF